MTCLWLQRLVASGARSVCLLGLISLSFSPDLLPPAWPATWSSRAFAAQDEPGAKSAGDRANPSERSTTTGLVRRYRPGETTVYCTELHSEATVRTQPPGLVGFLPPFPTEITSRQQNTVTVRAVHPGGGADVVNHFDRFELQSNLPERSPKELQASAEQSQQNFSRRFAGRTLVAHYDRQGRLTGLEGADRMLQPLDVLLRKPLEEALRLVVEQMGGGLYIDHAVKPTDKWSRKFWVPATTEEPWSLEGECTWRYSGHTRYGQVRAAIIDFQFSDVVAPALEELKQTTPLAQLGASSNGLTILVRGQGHGRLLVALDDGRVLQNQTQTQQTLTATLKGVPSGPSGPSPGTSPTGSPSGSTSGSSPAAPSSSAPDPLTVEITSQTTLRMDASEK
jgi:hypothetical protein